MPELSVAEPESPKKPISSKKWGMLILAGIVALLVAADLVSSIHFAGSKTSAPKQATAGTTPQLAVNSFDKNAQSEAADLNKQRAALQDAMAKFKDAPDLSALAKLPDCNEAERVKLAGQYYVASTPEGGPALRLRCEADDQWAVIPDHQSAADDGGTRASTEPSA